MKKLAVSMLVVVLLASGVNFAKAQSPLPVTNETLIALLKQLIEILIQQVKILQAQLQALGHYAPEPCQLGRALPHGRHQHPR